MYKSTVARDPGRFLARFCGATIGLALAASPTFLNGLLVQV